MACRGPHSNYRITKRRSTKRSIWENAPRLHLADYDAIVVHVWQCHIDLSDRHLPTWNYLPQVRTRWHLPDRFLQRDPLLLVHGILWRAVTSLTNCLLGDRIRVRFVPHDDLIRCAETETSSRAFNSNTSGRNADFSRPLFEAVLASWATNNQRDTGIAPRKSIL